MAGPQAKGGNWAKEATLSWEQQGAMGAFCQESGQIQGSTSSRWLPHKQRREE